MDALIIFLLLRQMQKKLKGTDAYARWEQKIKTGYILVGVLFALNISLKSIAITNWALHGYVLVVLVTIYREPDLYLFRKSMFAVFPLVLINVLKDIVSLFPESWRGPLLNYLEVGVGFAFVWMIVMLVINDKQQKALDKEKQKRKEEEEQKKVIEVRKSELEVMVAERTAEIMQQKEELEKALEELKATQSQLIQSEKMASLGELTAGIAHEIQNPLNFVNNFSEVNLELSAELKEELAAVTLPPDKKEVIDEILTDLAQNGEKIHHHGKRADAIVKGMLQHSRKSSGQKEFTDINELADEYLRLSYHGLRAKDKTFNASFSTDFDPAVGQINIIPQDVGRVFLNIINNAFYAVTEKKKALQELDPTNTYTPSLYVSTKRLQDAVEIRINDNGNGIPHQVLDKIFQPFFTTKPTGQGTGLGLSLSYEIIKAHGGEIEVETKENQGTTFIIQLPVD